LPASTATLDDAIVPGQTSSTRAVPASVLLHEPQKAGRVVEQQVLHPGRGLVLVIIGALKQAEHGVWLAVDRADLARRQAGLQRLDLGVLLQHDGCRRRAIDFAMAAWANDEIRHTGAIGDRAAAVWASQRNRLATIAVGGAVNLVCAAQKLALELVELDHLARVDRGRVAIGVVERQEVARVAEVRDLSGPARADLERQLALPTGAARGAHITGFVTVLVEEQRLAGLQAFELRQLANRRLRGVFVRHPAREHVLARRIASQPSVPSSNSTYHSLQRPASYRNWRRPTSVKPCPLPSFGQMPLVPICSGE
jgi:hypothetical protein